MDFIYDLLLIGALLAGQYMVFEKFGVDGWKSLIPFYNTYVLLDVFGYNPWLCLLSLVPLVNIGLMVFLSYQIAKAFGKGFWLTMGLVFIPMVIYPILGFSDMKCMVIR